MRLITVGYGRVGRQTASALRDEGHEVVVVDIEHEPATRARNDRYETVEGDGGTEQVLQRAGLAETDALAGLAGDLNANFSACVVGEAHGCRTVLRVDDEVSEPVYRRYTDIVGEVIYPESGCGGREDGTAGR
jgi:K+ transport systems, NAD-binding component